MSRKHLLIVSSGLQAVIAEQIIRNTDGEFTLAVLYKESIDEAGAYAKRKYEQLKGMTSVFLPIKTNDTLSRQTRKLLPHVIKVKLTKGSLYISAIDLLAAGIAGSMLNIKSVCTYDDGSANQIQQSHYWTEEPHPEGERFSQFIRLLLPKGACHWFRMRSQKHYSVCEHPSRYFAPNSHFIYLEIDWENEACPLDIQRISRLGPCNTILLGTRRPCLSSFMLDQSLRKAPSYDLCLLHPRDNTKETERIIRTSSPAEAIIAYLAKVNSHMTIYHYNSSTFYSLRHIYGNERISWKNLSSD